MKKITNLFDKTGNARFLTVNDILEKAKKVKDHPYGIVILVDKYSRNSFHLEILPTNLDLAEMNLVLDAVKHKLIGPP